MLYDRLEAGDLLGHKLKKYANEDGVVMAVPKGGVPVAYGIARQIGYPIDLVLVKKIGHPNNKEIAIGAASLNDYFILPDVNVSFTYLLIELKAIRERLNEMHRRYHIDTAPENIKDKTVIIVDDGIATGNTIFSAVQLLSLKKPKKIVVAVPVASRSAVENLSSHGVRVIALNVIDDEKLQSVSRYYQHFHQVGDGEVMFYLEKMRDQRQSFRDSTRV